MKNIKTQLGIAVFFRMNLVILAAAIGLCLGSISVVGAQEEPAGGTAVATPAKAEALLEEADKSAVVDDLVNRFATDDATAEQLQATLDGASSTTLLEIVQNADSLEAVNEILTGDAGPLVLGDLDQDYVFSPVTPCRIVDTRNVGGAFSPLQSREYYVYGGIDVSSQGGNPAGCFAPRGEPRGVHINVTAVPLSGTGNFRAYPANIGAPNASLVNYKSGVQNIANAASVKTFFSIGPREIEIRNGNGTAHLVIDILGYYYDAIQNDGVEWANADVILSIGTNTTVETITVTSPTSGFVVVNASGNFRGTGAAGKDIIRCSITTGTTIDFSALQVVQDGGDTDTVNAYEPVSLTRGFVKPAGSTTYRFVCDEFSGVTEIWDPSMTAVFSRQRY